MVPLLTPGASGSSRRRRFSRWRAGRRRRTSYPHLARADLLVSRRARRTPWPSSRRARRQRAHRGGARPSRSRARRSGDEPAHVVAPGDARECRALLVRPRRRAVGPDEGELAEGEWGVGAGSRSPRRSPHASSSCSRPGSLAGKRVLVTAGGTREPLDSVRFVGNRSSGRMGVALAEEARRRGAEVILLAANLQVEAPLGVETIPTPTAEAMLDAALALADVDVALLAAAVADYRPAEAHAAKRTKDDRGWTIELAPTEDVAGRSAERKRRRADPRRLRSRARRGRAGAKARHARDEERRSRRLQRRRRDTTSASTRAENEVVLVTRSGRADRAQGAEAGDRARDPRRGRGAVGGADRPR